MILVIVHLRAASDMNSASRDSLSFVGSAAMILSDDRLIARRLGFAFYGQEKAEGRVTTRSMPPRAVTVIFLQEQSWK